jgi:predicted nucleic acid-binding protein
MRGNLVRRVYWDSSTFLGLLNKEAGRHSEILAVWKEAESGRTLIYTSFLTFVEVFKIGIEGNDKPLAEAKDRDIEALLSQSFIIGAVLEPCRKPLSP